MLITGNEVISYTDPSMVRSTARKNRDVSIFMYKRRVCKAKLLEYERYGHVAFTVRPHRQETNRWYEFRHITLQAYGEIPIRVQTNKGLSVEFKNARWVEAYLAKQIREGTI